MRRVMGLMAAALLSGAANASPPNGTQIATLARQAMADTGARGLAIAVIDRGHVASVQAFGARNARGDPLTVETVMYGASITKALFAYTVMQLVDEKRVDLDRPIAAMLAQPLPDYGNLDAYGHWADLAGDDRWRSITPRHLLTHSGGFRNFWWDEPDEKLKINFTPGSRYSYSGEGMILLQFALEAGLGLKLGDEMQRRLFDRWGMRTTSMMWRPDFERNLADGWKIDGSVEPHDERSRVRAAGSMDTSIADMARAAAGMVRGDGLSRASRSAMVRPHLAITSRSQFPVLAPEAPPGQRWPGLAAGLGVISFFGPQGRGFMKGGHNDSTANMMVCIEARKRCVVILSNDVRAEASFPRLVEKILGGTGFPWAWEYPSIT